MKHILLFLLLFAGMAGHGQVTCTVSPEQKTLCYGGTITLTATAEPDTVAYTYQWLRGSGAITDSTRKYLLFPEVTFADTGFYYCVATSEFGDSDTSNAAHLMMLPKLTIDTLYRSNSLGCPGVCKGQMKTRISGGTPPYTYQWYEGNPYGYHNNDTMVDGLCEGKYTLKVYDNDSSYCVFRNYKIEVLKVPEVVFTTDPGDTVYLTNPFLTVEYPDTSKKDIATWTWKFGDTFEIESLNPATHAYTTTGEFVVKLQYEDMNGCVDSVADTVIVRTAKLRISPLLTPNGDQKNDTFIIKAWKDDETSIDIDLREVYISNEMIIFDRWGKKVYSKTNYLSGDWDGGNLADGVYYFVFKCHGQYGDDVYKGSVVIMARDFNSGQ